MARSIKLKTSRVISVFCKIVAGFALVGACTIATSKDGNQPYIYKGFKPDPKLDLSWQVAIIRKAGKQELLCGGALIGARWVLTAAHCFSKDIAGAGILGSADILVVAKSRRLDDPARFVTSVAIVEKYAYEGLEYNDSSQRFDAALLRLTDPLNATTLALATVSNPELTKIGTHALVFGWGITESGAISNTLLAANVSIQSNEICEKSGPGIPPLVDSLMICAGGSVAVSGQGRHLERHGRADEDGIHQRVWWTSWMWTSA